MYLGSQDIVTVIVFTIHHLKGGAHPLSHRIDTYNLIPRSLFITCTADLQEGREDRFNLIKTLFTNTRRVASVVQKQIFIKSAVTFCVWF